jgi:hypothetical protein
MLDAESLANDLLRRARLDTGELVPLRAVAAALGYTLVVARSANIHDHTLPGVIVFDGTIRALAHALGHVAMKLNALPEPHDETMVAAIGARLVTPASAFRRGVRMGLERADLSAAFGVSQTCAVLRRSELTGEPSAVVTPHMVYARGDWSLPAEDIVRRWVKQRAKWIKQARLGDDPRRILVVPR